MNHQKMKKAQKGILVCLGVVGGIALVVTFFTTLFAFYDGLKRTAADFDVSLYKGKFVGYAKAQVEHPIDSEYGTMKDFEHIFIEVDPPHPALHIIYTQRKPSTVVVDFKSYKSVTQAEPQKCEQVNVSSWCFLRDQDLWVETTTDVADVAVLLVESSHFSDISNATYNGSNYWWFKRRAVKAAQGANNSFYAYSYLLPDEFRIFVCNPLNHSAPFEVDVDVRKKMYKAFSSDGDIEWVGQKSIKVASANTYSGETVIAQFVVDEPTNETLTAKVRVKGRLEGGFAAIIAEIVMLSLLVVLVALAALVWAGPRCVMRCKNRNNWQNISDSERSEFVL